MARVSISHPTDSANFTIVHVGPLSITFSYTTPIAFSPPDGPRVVRVNDWSTTTGKHLNYVDGGDTEAKKARVSGEEFGRQLDALLARMSFQGWDF